MNPKTFSGKTMAEALRSVKSHFGADAVILNTRVEKSVLGRAPVVEITAAAQHPDLPEFDSAPNIKMGAGETRRADSGTGDTGTVSRTTLPTSAHLPSSDRLADEVHGLKSAVHQLIRESSRQHAGDLPPPLFHAYQRLVENDVAEQIARQLVESVRVELPAESLNSHEAIDASLRRTIASSVPTAGPIQIPDGRKPFTVAFIGPTGVGKTTTVAKLAANFRLREQRRVGLITVDTYRIAAVEQLRTYAQIIDVPLVVAASPSELADAIRRLKDCDVILIDSAGRSQRDERKGDEMRGMFAAARPDEIHLVLSSTCGERVMAETVERFSDFDVNRIIVTKLDEAVGFGVILNCLQIARAKLSYFTTGQGVPDDIEIGTAGLLIDRIIGSSSPSRDGLAAVAAEREAAAHEDAPKPAGIFKQHDWPSPTLATRASQDPRKNSQGGR